MKTVLPHVYSTVNKVLTTLPQCLFNQTAIERIDQEKGRKKRTSTPRGNEVDCEWKNLYPRTCHQNKVLT